MRTRPHSRFSSFSKRAAVLAALTIAALTMALPARAATFTVTKTADTNDGACDADCSLREAILAANATPEHDTVVLPAGTYLLTLTGGDDHGAVGDLDIRSPLTLQGAGAGATTIDGTGLGDNRVIQVHPMGGVGVTLSGVTITGGRITVANGGGITCNEATLNLQDVTLRDNSAGGNAGGGLHAEKCTVAVAGSRISNNTAGQGAGIYVYDGALAVNGSRLSENVASESGGALMGLRAAFDLGFSTLEGNTAANAGGGVFLAGDGSTLAVANCLVTGNQAGVEAGGLAVMAGEAAVIENTTVSGNDGGRWAGGVAARIPTTITHSTITGNAAGETDNGGGGGLFAYQGLARVDVHHTILAGNTSRNQASTADCYRWGGGQVISNGYNLVLTPGGCSFTAQGDITGQDPLLAPLADNGGPTWSHDLLPGSPAREAGDPAFVPPPQFDQRGPGFPRQTGRIDIGALETEPSVYRSWIQVASRAAGAQGSQWRTDLGLLNPGSAPAAAQLRFHGAGGVLTRQRTVAPGQQLILADVVAEFGVSGSAGFEVVSDRPLKVSSRTYNAIAPAAPCAPGGTFGQNYDAFTPEQGLTSGQSAWLPQLTENAAYRSNIALTNMSTTPASAAVALFDGAGAQIGAYTVELAPGQRRQEDRPFFHKAGQTAMARGYAQVAVTQGSGVLASASVVDNTTNDPTTIPMQEVLTAPATVSWIQVAARAAGAQGSQWRSDLGILNPGVQAATVQVRFHKGGSVKQSSLAVAPGQQAILVDVVSQIPETGSGAMEILASQPVVVSSRTYNQVAGGAECFGGGTLGQNYDAFTPARALQQGQTAYLAQLQENPAYRTNIALTNAGAAPAQVTVTLFDGGGIQIGQYIVSLAPGERKQEDRPFFHKAGQNALAAGYARVTVTQGSGLIVSASVVDNVTNDPTTMPAIRTEYAGGYATDLVFPFEDETLIGDESQCYGLTNWNAPLNTEIHSGIDLAARYNDLAVNEARHVRIVAPAAGTGLYVYEMLSGKGADSILVLIQMNDYWYLPLTFEPQSTDAATSALQRENMAVDLSGLDCSTGCYFPRQIAKGEWIGDLIVRNVMEDAYPHIHYSLLYKSPAQTLEDAFANNLEIARNQGTGMPPTSGPGSPVSPMELAGTPTTFYCVYEYSSAAAKTIMDTMVMRSLDGVCSCACAYNSVDGDCGVCP